MKRSIQVAGILAFLFSTIPFHGWTQCVPDPCINCACFNTAYSCHSNNITSTILDFYNNTSVDKCEVYNCAKNIGQGDEAAQAYIGRDLLGSFDLIAYGCLTLCELFNQIYAYQSSVGGSTSSAIYDASVIAAAGPYTSCEIYACANTVGEADAAIRAMVFLSQFNGDSSYINSLTACLTLCQIFNGSINYLVNSGISPYEAADNTSSTFSRYTSYSSCDIYNCAIDPSYRSGTIGAIVYWRGPDAALDTCISPCELYDAVYTHSNFIGWLDGIPDTAGAAFWAAAYLSNYTSYSSCDILSCARNIGNDSIAIDVLVGRQYSGLAGLDTCASACELYQPLVNWYIFSDACWDTLLNPSGCDSTFYYNEAAYTLTESGSYTPCEIYQCVDSAYRGIGIIGALQFGTGWPAFSNLQYCADVCTIYDYAVGNGFDYCFPGLPCDTEYIYQSAILGLITYTSFTPCEIYNCVEPTYQSGAISAFLNNGVSKSYLNDTCGIPCDITLSCDTTLYLSLKLFLSGPYDSGTGLMHDSLRTKGLIPLTEPYSSQFTHYFPGGGETMDTSVLLVADSNAIVDWVFIELRDKMDTSVVATRSALLQRDGDVVDVDGISPVSFEGTSPDDYFITVRHRNHLGVMTATTYSLSPSSPLVDFTTISTFGTNAMQELSGVRAMWSGNALPDKFIKFSGPNNDRDAILVRIGGVIPTNTVAGYFPEDVNMDGLVKFSGPDNDVDVILYNIGGAVPTNVVVEQLP